MAHDPKLLLEEGIPVLTPLLGRHSFRLARTDNGQGSGGRFAVATFRNGRRALELHVRTNLGIVNYRLGDAVLEHRDYMRFPGKQREAAYPTFSRERLGAFRALLADLDRFAGDFLAGRGLAAFESYAAQLADKPDLFRRLP